MKKKYDIFISYRRKDVGDKAEHLKDLLEPHYKKRISFDRENLGGLFDVNLIKRIDQCKDFILLIGKHSLEYTTDDFDDEKVTLYNYLGSCSQTEFEQKIIELGIDSDLDFVRIEIARALHRKELNLIPVVPESSENFDFSTITLPPDISHIKRYEAVFYSDSSHALFKEVEPKIRKHLRSMKNPSGEWFVKILICLLCLSGIITGGINYQAYLDNKKEKLETQHKKEQKQEQQEALDRIRKRKEELKSQISSGSFQPTWDNSLTLEQIQAIGEILHKMVYVEGGSYLMGAAKNSSNQYDTDVCIELETPQIKQTVGSFWMGKYEVTVSEWKRILKEDYPKSDSLMPITHISFSDCKKFVKRLNAYTGLNFQLPQESEWEFAARGGNTPDCTKYAGSENAAQVAWYGLESAHICEARHSDKYCNALDLYDMSGNVSEWCDTDFRLYSDLATANPHPSIIDPDSKVIRGGNFLSDLYELTVYHRDPMNKNEKSENVGLRLIIRK